MWNDSETTEDLLNFKIVADTAARIIKERGGQPISIGVSGSWGMGKSSLVKMIGNSIQEIDKGGRYLFVDFNAWLYQGYDDARMALLQIVADTIYEKTKKNRSLSEKAMGFIKRIKVLRSLRFFTPIVVGASVGGALGGPLGAFLGAASSQFAKRTAPTADEWAKLTESYDSVESELSDLLMPSEEKSIPKEITAIRKLFQELLSKLKTTLVICVDDLDRCLPDTAISTLEAMRLLLFIPGTVFIIAADEQMIRNAVRHHFRTDLSEELVTSYFDKLIQLPIQVPRLSTNEIKGYLILLLAELAVRKGSIPENVQHEAQEKILDIVKKSWKGGLTKRIIQDAYGLESASILSKEIDMADQLAYIMVASDKIRGNPRLIKRFLNNFLIRQSIAESQGISVGFGEMIKFQLFERCASKEEFETLANDVASNEKGQSKLLQDIEAKIKKGMDCSRETMAKSIFMSRWLELEPPLGNIDLRPLIYLSRDRALPRMTYDELSLEAQNIFDALCNTGDLTPGASTRFINF